MMVRRDDGAALFSVMFVTLGVALMLGVLSINLVYGNRIETYREESVTAYWMAKGCAKDVLQRVRQGEEIPRNYQVDFPTGVVSVSLRTSLDVTTVTVVSRAFGATDSLQFSYSTNTKAVFNWQDNMVPS